MSQPIVPNKVTSEPLIIQKGDTFDMRWLPKYDDGIRRVRTIPISAPVKNDEVVSARPSVAPNDRNRNLDAPNDHDKRPIEPVIMPPEQNETVPNTRGYGHLVPRRERKVKVASLHKRDQRTCLRHDMKTVYYGKHRWRCRR